jgi:hypothetical protein
MRWTRRGPDLTQWHPWFAWRPVRLGRQFHADGSITERHVWGELVERKLVPEHMGSYWAYRAVGDKCD